VHREMSEWTSVLETLAEGNREWAHAASHLVLFLAKETHDGRVNGSCEFDTGASWMSFALQAHRSGLGTHPMGGFDRNAALRALKVPSGYRAMAIVAVGFIGSADLLPEHRRESERTRSDRLSIERIAHAGSFPEDW